MKKANFILFIVIFISSISIASENVEMGDIGLSFYKEPFYNKTIIINKFPNSPASVIPIGSEIIRINGKKIYFLSPKKITNRLQGNVSTNVLLTIKDINGNIKDYSITRVPFSELKFDEKFDFYWGMIAPEKYMHTPNYDDLIKIKSKLCVLDNSISNEDFNWAEKRTKFVRFYNYCLQLKSTEQKECLNFIVQNNKNTDKPNTEIKQDSVSNKDNKWLAGLYMLQMTNNTMNTINNNAIQRTQFYNDLSERNNINRLNNILHQQNIELQKINNTLKGKPNSVIQGDQRYY